MKTLTPKLRWAAIMVSLLFLTGCGVNPTGEMIPFEELTHWRELFFPPEGTGSTQAMMDIAFLAFSLSFAMAVFGLLKTVFARKGLELLVMGMLFMAVSSALSHQSQIMYNLAQKAFGDTTLDMVADAVRWDLSINPLELAADASGFAFTMQMPIYFAFYLMFAPIFNAIALVGSILQKSMRGIILFLAQLMGLVAFFTFYRDGIQKMAQYTGYFETVFSSGSAFALNTVYIAWVIFIAVVCLWYFPYVAYKALGNWADEVTIQWRANQINDVVHSGAVWIKGTMPAGMQARTDVEAPRERATWSRSYKHTQTLKKEAEKAQASGWQPQTTGSPFTRMKDHHKAQVYSNFPAPAGGTGTGTTPAGATTPPPSRWEKIRNFTKRTTQKTKVAAQKAAPYVQRGVERAAPIVIQVMEHSDDPTVREAAAHLKRTRFKGGTK